MNWIWFHRTPLPPPIGRGRVGTRLLRGVLWAIVGLFLYSVLAFALGQWLAHHPPHVFRLLYLHLVP